MKTHILKAASGMAFAFALAGCESASQIARKPALSDSLLVQSSEMSSHIDAPELRSILMMTTTKALETLSSQNIRIVLDERLAAQKSGFLDRPLDAVFYNHGNGNRVVSLRLREVSEEEEARCAAFLDSLTHRLRKGDFEEGSTYFGYTSGHMIGTDIHQTFEWEDANEFIAADNGKKKDLLIAPVRAGKLQL